MTTSTAPSAEHAVHNVVAAMETAAAIDAARRLGILNRLAASPQTIAELTDDLRSDPRATGRLTEALLRLGVLHDDGHGLLFADSATVQCLELMSDEWAQLPRVIQTGTPVRNATSVDGAEVLYPNMVSLLAAWCSPAAGRLGDLLSPCAGEVLDVGAGAAPWSIAVATRNSDTRITAVDYPAVLPATRRAVDHAGLTARFRYLAGDVFALELPPARYDLVIVGNLCHLLGPSQNRALLSTLRQRIRPGGRLAIIDVLPSADPLLQLMISRYELGLLLRTKAGRVHPLSAYREWTGELGFPGLTHCVLSSDPPVSALLSQPIPTG